MSGALPQNIFETPKKKSANEAPNDDTAYIDDSGEKGM